MDLAQLAYCLKVLSVASRLRILQLLKGRALCVGTLAARLHVTQGAVSQHLRILREAGLVIAERRGYYVHYRLNEAVLREWRVAIDTMLPCDQNVDSTGEKPNGLSCRNRSLK